MVGGREFDSTLEERVHFIWNESILAKPHLWNGSMLSLVNDSGGTLLAEQIEYRYWYFQMVTGTDLGIRPIAVTGVLRLDGDLIFGRRSSQVTQEASQWELAPSGGVSSSRMSFMKSPSLSDQLSIESEEELNFNMSLFGDPSLLGFLDDEQTGVRDYIYRCDLNISWSRFNADFASRKSREYLDIRLASWNALESASWVSQSSQRIIQAIKYLL